MVWARMLAHITGTVDQELLVRNEYLAAENRCPSSKQGSGVQILSRALGPAEEEIVQSTPSRGI